MEQKKVGLCVVATRGGSHGLEKKGDCIESQTKKHSAIYKRSFK